MTERQGTFTIPTRLYLSEGHRTLLEHIVRQQRVDLAEWISAVVAEHLDTLADAPPPANEEVETDGSEEIARRRAEIAKLRARRKADGRKAPKWLDSYIATLEEEVGRMSR
ncbi:MAG: hypothetical protein GFH27_549279n64 [Chloroflexi bacterium AL-W]|nr:hypothetical protein [Chloroflexi bacterium AL-N1]NOK71075.1 hypothetical protein [Chloroflexi bacterium AL-N10]NOK72703.1 hypothetical protein [Chloroflexi bacterium AL-N5]NOK79209.1 hypothetical protein [Chloroflexi bacterium AL-W]NOK87125.1 hypothetical protein [Chloroflexi bacterium AL-N15]